MIGSVARDVTSGEVNHRRAVWHALVAYVGDTVAAQHMLADVLAEDERLGKVAPTPDRWARLFAMGRYRSPSQLESTVELLVSTDDSELFGSTIAGLSRLLTSLGALPAEQRMAVIGKHVCALVGSDLATMLTVSEPEAVGLLGAAEAALADLAKPGGPGRLRESASRTTARRFTALERLPLPDAVDQRAEPEQPARRHVDPSTALTAVLVGSAGIVGLLLVAGNSGLAIDRTEERTATTTATSAAVTSVTSIGSASGSETDQRELQAELQSALRGSDHSRQISVSAEGEVVRQDLQSGEEIWRTAPLGEIELESVDLNTVTIRKGTVLLRLSLTDGTFLPP